MPHSRPSIPTLGLRWTIGDVSPRGFECLRLSLWGAWRMFGPRAAYAVVVNSLPATDALRRAGPVPGAVRWLAAHGLPDAIARHLDHGMAEGVAWKFAPVRVFDDVPELALDNDVVLWDVPEGLSRWLAEPDSFLLAEDVTPAFGRFAGHCGPEPRNLGIRGIPAEFDLTAALAAMLEREPGPLASELDEQGLQVATLQAAGPCHTVWLDEVSVCSPFWPHRPEVGRCGAHFVGLNARHIPWSYYDRPATEVRIEHWERHRPDLHRRVGLGAPI